MMSQTSLRGREDPARNEKVARTRDTNARRATAGRPGLGLARRCPGVGAHYSILHPSQKNAFPSNGTVLGRNHSGSQRGGCTVLGISDASKPVLPCTTEPGQHQTARPPGTQRAGLVGKAGRGPSGASRGPRPTRPAPGGRGSRRQNAPCGPRHAPCFFEGVSGGSLGRRPSLWQSMAHHLPGPCRLRLCPCRPCPAGGSHGSCVRGRLAGQGDLVLLQGRPRGAPSFIAPGCGRVSSQESSLPSALPGLLGWCLLHASDPAASGHL